VIDVSIVIVSYNSHADLERCLASLHEPSPEVTHEIIVVDNDSSDDSADAARHWRDVRVIELDANRGFAAASNIGIREGASDLILLLNSDTIVPTGATDMLVRELRNRPDVAVVGPRLVDARGRPELSFGRMISPLAEWRQKRLMQGLDRLDPEVLRRVEAMTRQEQWPDWVSGACLLVRRTDAETAGLIDERYFMYLEDVDFCAAIRARGRRVLFTPSVEIVHLRGRSAARAPAATSAAYRRSQIAFYQKHHPTLARLLRVYLRARGVSPHLDPAPPR
jgi:N-acetylglucosaminyl-diphospho-decaprenol L-rhamnosyltransferase